MADDSGLEKQHSATAKRIAEMRKQGSTLRSKDLTSGLVLIVTLMMLFYLSHSIKLAIQDNFIFTFNNIKEVVNNNEPIMTIVRRLALNNFILLLPLFIVSLVTAFLSPFIFGGWNFTLQPIQFKFSGMNPINNLKNLFSKKIALNILKSMLKVSIIIGVLISFSFNHKIAITNLYNLPLQYAINSALGIAKDFIFILSASLVVIILYDVISNYFEYQQKMKMSTQEVKDEFKETEGNTEVKRKIRANQFAMIKQRVSVTVPQATVVITNPTHYAVAIRYDDRKDKAPKIIAKGKGYVAQQIRQLAIANGVPIYQAPLLARAIFRTSKVGAEINPGLYMSIAIVLSYVNQLKRYQHGMGQEPSFVSDLKIPPEFIYHE